MNPKSKRTTGEKARRMRCVFGRSSFIGAMGFCNSGDESALWKRLTHGCAGELSADWVGGIAPLRAATTCSR